jgi:acid phosphatase (class A)
MRKLAGSGALTLSALWMLGAVYVAAQGAPPPGPPPEGAGPPPEAAPPDAGSLPAGGASRRLCSVEPPKVTFFLNSEADTIGLLGAPPSLDVAAQKADLQGVLAAQAEARKSGTTQRAIDDSELNCARFKDVLGAQLKSPAAAAALKVVNDGALSAIEAANPSKKYWKRPRPYIVSKAVTPLADVAPDGEMATTEYGKDCDPDPPAKNAEVAARRAAKKAKDRYEKDYTSYPSGHATFGMACGLLLSAMIPEKRAELYARARQYGESRLIVGAHFPSDVEQGRVAGAIGVLLDMQSARYQQLFYGAQAELRAALGYPVKLPDLEPEKDLFKGPAPQQHLQRTAAQAP